MPPDDDFSFAAYPAPFVHDAPGGKKIQHLIWGDHVRRLGGEQDGWVEVRSRGTNGWMRAIDLQEERLLEVNFVDIGQGDGAFLVTPDDRFLVVDAGERDNMYRFLRWRFNLRAHPDEVIDVDAAVITHPDADHYKGFDWLFDSRQLRFGTVYHNGIVERTGDAPLGARVSHGGEDYLTELVRDDAALADFLSVPARVGRKLYPNLLKTAATAGRVGSIRMLTAEDGHLPGYDDPETLEIRVLGPVLAAVDGTPALPWFGDPGKTKNGHSVVLKLVYREVSILLGGDLNIPSEHYLLAHYTGLDPEDQGQREAVIAKAREVLECDVAKACHHGSADFTDLWLRAVNPIATVVSSGDAESHCHPRPDALGAFGKAGRGDRPLIFSTELARSSRETIKEPNRLRAEIQRLFDERAAADDPDRHAEIQQKIDAKLATLERSVSVYGMISLRTDGRKVLIAQRLEEPRMGNQGLSSSWDLHRLEPGDDGRLHYVSKH